MDAPEVRQKPERSEGGSEEGKKEAVIQAKPIEVDLVGHDRKAICLSMNKVNTKEEM